MNYPEQPTLEQLRRSPHWSFSRLGGLLNYCSLAWAFKYVYREPPEFTPVALVFGSAFHCALAQAFSRKKKTGEVCVAEATDLFRDRLGKELAGRQPPRVRLTAKATPETLTDLGTRMVETYLNQIDPAEQVLGVSIPFSTVVAGEEAPMIGEFDAVVEKHGRRTIVDWKTSARRWPANKAATDLQPTIYLPAHAAMTGDWETDFRFDVVTKTKTPACEQHRTTRAPSDARRLASIIKVLRRRVWAEVFHPADQSWECGNCPYVKACRKWHLDREKAA